jgi:signal transduction histidine kinase
MRLRLAIVFFVVVTLPLAIVGWLGARVAREEQAMVRLRFQELLHAQLGVVEQRMATVISDYEQRIIVGGALSRMAHDQLRERAAASPEVLQFFVTDMKERLLYPSEDNNPTEAEGHFLEAAARLWEAGEVSFTTSAESEADAPLAAPMTKGGKGGYRPPPVLEKGWHTWHFGARPHFLFWWRDEAGIVVGAEVRRARLIADVIAALPHDQPEVQALETGCIQVMDAEDRVVYQWGDYSPKKEQSPAVDLRPAAPVGAWKLAYYVPPDFFTRGVDGGRFNLVLGLLALALVVAGLAVYVFRETTRDAREAQQRVSFVNRVSHELKTPLTNIRMYAELLAEGLVEEEAAATHKHLRIIVAESQRLSRLINNVLTFGRKERQALRLHPVPGCVDDAVREVAGHFEAALAQRGFAIELALETPEEVRFDGDAVQQIIGNLLSNVEKYAVGGDTVTIISARNSQGVFITVRDNGPGIGKTEARRIFEPFYRVRNTLNDGVAGTGIGLSIARDLAVLHGGGLILESTEGGAFFRLSFRVEEV